MANVKIRDPRLLAAALPVATAILTVGFVPAALAAAHGYTVLYNFTDGNDGGYSQAGLIQDKAGNLYGTTYGGGSGNGVVFKLAPDGTETVLHAFTGGSDGANPLGGVIRDKAGNLFGTTTYGGGYGGGSGDGTVFKVAADGTESVIYAFTGNGDQANPVASLIEDSAGNLYGTTCSGQRDQYGTVCEISKKGTYVTLHSFNGADDGQCLQAALFRDSSGNLYGTATYAGAGGAGVIFELAKNGTETVLYPFTGGKDGGYPVTNLVQDSSGNLYGTTEGGGGNGGGVNGSGVVFRLATDGTETALTTFKSSDDGANPEAGLIAGKNGMLYGTARNAGAAGAGVVFKVKE